METTFDNLVRFFEEEEFKHQVDQDHATVTASFRAKHLTVRLHFTLDANDGLLQVFAPLPGFAPEGCRTAIAEAVTRANYRMKVGKFEFDFSDGEVRFHVANVFSETGLESAIIHRIIGTSIGMVDRYFPAFMSVIYGNEPAGDAICHVEQPLE